MRGNSNALESKRSTTFANAAALADADAFKTLVATDPTGANTYSGADLDGILANPGPVTETMMRIPRFPSVTTTVDAATYNTTDPIVCTGTRDGEVATVELLLTAAGGGETIVGDEPLDTLVSIYVPTQLQNIGEFTFGFSGVGARIKHGMTQRLAFKGLADGTVTVGYEDGLTDGIVVTSGLVEAASPYRIYAFGTTVGVTVYG